VVIENWSVGVAERLGIGYEALRAIKPDIIMVQMPGFAQEPPESERVGFGPTIEQMGGLVALQGYEGGEPHKSGISYGDPTSGITTAGAIGFALLRRSRTGQGAHVVVTQRNNIINLVGEFIVAESAGLPYLVRAGNRDTDAVPHNVYRTRDDRVPRPQADVSGRHIGVFADTWIAIAIDSDEAWAALCAAVADPRLDRSEWTRADGRREAEAEIDAILAEWARQQDAEEIAGALQPRGVDACPVFSPLGLVRDPHLADRGYYEYTMHPDAGRHRTTRPVWRMTARPTPPPRPAPCFGEHNHELLREAGYSDSEIADLEAAGILASEPREA
jgi:crotonobetainyl-CoA:carnitine CoA-transferase CaiB-like acyl-CoA transferase